MTTLFTPTTPITPVRLACLFFVAISAAACASGKPGAKGDRTPNAALYQPQRLLDHARNLQAEKGCAAAAPMYRVIASFGVGYDVAQYELGACLKTMTGENDPETALFQKEAALWLERAAWAGNARAQKDLAILLSGADRQARTTADPAAALGWALVYEENAQRELFGLQNITPPILSHIHARLTADQKRAAEAFAANFEEITLASFTPPAAQRGERASGRPDAGSIGRERRRPRLAK